MLWQVVAFLKENSVAAVPKPWIKLKRGTKYLGQCYWRKYNVDSLRRKGIQPPVDKNGRNFHDCKILMDGEIFASFEKALEAEKKLTAKTKSRKKNHPVASAIVQFKEKGNTNSLSNAVQDHNLLKKSDNSVQGNADQDCPGIPDIGPLNQLNQLRELNNFHVDEVFSNTDSVVEYRDAVNIYQDYLVTPGLASVINESCKNENWTSSESVVKKTDAADINENCVDTSNSTNNVEETFQSAGQSSTTSTVYKWKKRMVATYKVEANSTNIVPVITESPINEPVITLPVITQPVITDPVITDPATTNSVITDPLTTDTVTTDPVISSDTAISDYLVITDSFKTNSVNIETEAVLTTPCITERIIAEPSTTELATEASITEPLVTEQFFADLLYSERMITERLDTEPSTTEASITEPLVTQQFFADLLYSERMITERLDTEPWFAGSLITERNIADPWIFDPSIAYASFPDPSVTEQFVAEPSIEDPCTLQPSNSEQFFAEPWIPSAYETVNETLITESLNFKTTQVIARSTINESITTAPWSIEQLTTKPSVEQFMNVEDYINQNGNNGEEGQCHENLDDSSDPGSDDSDSSVSDGELEFRIQPLGSNNYRDSRCYLYTKNSSRKSNLYLRCKNNIKHECPSRVTVRDNNFNEAVMTIPHNHPPDSVLLDKEIFTKKLEENIDRDPFESPRQLYLRTKTELTNKIDTTNIPSLKKMEGFIYRRQRKYIPLLPSTVEEFEKYIMDGKYRPFFTNDYRNLPYYRGIWTSLKGERNLVFIFETILKLINTLNHISFFLDGTFKALPHHLRFRQLYVICVTYENQCYPLAYIFMEKKTFTSYDTIFQNLKLLMPSVEVVKLMTDYEAATRKALKKHYPNARLSGCFFHYVQAIVKSSKRFGLRREEKFKEAIMKVCALALLPNDFVLKGFYSIDEAFKNSKSERWNRFREYWLKQWAPANISVYGLVDRSNNFSESNNKSLNLLIKKRHPNIWNLIMNLKLLEMDKSDQISRVVKGEMIFTKRSKSMVLLNDKIVKATQLFDEDENVANFLAHVTCNENLELFVKNQVDIMNNDSSSDVGDDQDVDEVIPNDYSRESDFRKNHPRTAVSQKNKKQ